MTNGTNGKVRVVWYVPSPPVGNKNKNMDKNLESGPSSEPPAFIGKK